VVLPSQSPDPTSHSSISLSRHSWFDRDLGLAGRAMVADSKGGYTHRLFNLNRYVYLVEARKGSASTLGFHPTTISHTTVSQLGPSCASPLWPSIWIALRMRTSSSTMRPILPPSSVPPSRPRRFFRLFCCTLLSPWTDTGLQRILLWPRCPCHQGGRGAHRSRLSPHRSSPHQASRHHCRGSLR
jgi:hypothetical protein